MSEGVPDTVTAAEIFDVHMYLRMLKISDDNIECTYSMGGKKYSQENFCTKGGCIYKKVL